MSLPSMKSPRFDPPWPTLALAMALSLGGISGASAELLLPTPTEPSGLEAIAVRVGVSPRPDGLHAATITLTVANPTSANLDFVLDAKVPEDLRRSLVVTRAGETIRVSEEGLAKVRLEPSEVAVLQVSRLVRTDLLAYLPAADSGWYASRGGLLQPLRQLTMRHPAASPFAAAAHEVMVDPGGLPLASAVLCTEGGLYEAGRISWSRGMGETDGAFSVTWPVVENETFLPLTRDEARAFVDYWSDRRIGEADVQIVRAGLEAGRGIILADAEARRILSKERRAGWSYKAGPLPVAERAADDVLATFRGSTGPSSPVRVARAQPRPSAAPQDQSPAEPTSPRREFTAPAQTPTEVARAPKAEPAPTRVDRSGRKASLVPPETRLSAEEYAAGDDDPLVMRAPDPSWLSETLLRSTASIPDDAPAARRWVRRALRDGHGLSRAVLAREAIPAMHGKTWAPGYVAEFFQRQTWYTPNPNWRQETAMSDDETRAHEILGDLVTALSGEPDPIGSSVLPEVPAETHVGHVAQAPAAPTERVASKPRRPSPTPPAEPVIQAPSIPSGQPLPWLMNTGQARVFLFKEKAKGLDRARLNQAVAVIEARHGKPFSDEPHLRQHFDGMSWYEPRDDYGPTQLSIPAREVITLLRNAGADAQ